VLLVDKPAGVCWIYERRPEGFVVRDERPAAVLTEGPVNRYRAADEPNYDVVAAPWVGADNAEEVTDGDAGQ
jgi:hypothetical protein